MPLAFSLFLMVVKLIYNVSLEGHEAAIGSSTTLVKYIKQIFSHKNFMWFAAMNLVQVCACLSFNMYKVKYKTVLMF